MKNYQAFEVSTTDHVTTLSFNRPDKANALHSLAWEELHSIFDNLSEDDDTRIIILKGNGKHFCAGIDVSMLFELLQKSETSCQGRQREQFLKNVTKLQACINAIEKCKKPVIAMIHGACLGAGLDIAAACDMRFSADDASFSIKEIDWGMVADLGVLQRLPKFVALPHVAELAYSGKNISGQKAASINLVNQSFEDMKDMTDYVKTLAQQIAQKSPLSIRGIKENLLYARDHSVANALHHQSVWNAAMIISDDFTECVQANFQKRNAIFGP